MHCVLEDAGSAKTKWTIIEVAEMGLKQVSFILAQDMSKRRKRVADRREKRWIFHMRKRFGQQ